MDDLHDRAVQLWLEKASDYTRLNESIGAVVDLVLERAAKTAEEFGWTLPMFESAELNEATDDAACSVQEQIAAAIRSLFHA